ncbi:hypothetical protein NC77_21860 [Janthinobacterium lividum]|nr:hypothetical protein NC77_21860 [Janthinobacterium lividum]
MKTAATLVRDCKSYSKHLTVLLRIDIGGLTPVSKNFPMLMGDCLLRRYQQLLLLQTLEKYC